MANTIHELAINSCLGLTIDFRNGFHQELTVYTYNHQTFQLNLRIVKVCPFVFGEAF